MKTAVMTLVLALSFMGLAHAEESTTEKAGTQMDNAARGVKKGMNRAKEAVCMEGDLKCAAKKAKHRATETGDVIKDKGAEIKDKVD